MQKSLMLPPRTGPNYLWAAKNCLFPPSFPWSGHGSVHEGCPFPGRYCAKADFAPSVPVSSQTAGVAKGSESPMSFVQTNLPDPQAVAGTKESFRPAPFQSFSPAKIFLGLSALSQANEPVLNDILMGLALKSDVRDDQFLPKIIKDMGLSFEKNWQTALKTPRIKKRLPRCSNSLRTRT